MCHTFPARPALVLSLPALYRGPCFRIIESGPRTSLHASLPNAPLMAHSTSPRFSPALCGTLKAIPVIPLSHLHSERQSSVTSVLLKNEHLPEFAGYSVASFYEVHIGFHNEIVADLETFAEMILHRIEFPGRRKHRFEDGMAGLSAWEVDAVRPAT
jgi:hypothetical protein